MEMAAKDALRRFVEEALPAARDHAQLVDELRHALEQGDERGALAIARRLCGLPAMRATA
jgi:hypothetical protein